MSGRNHVRVRLQVPGLDADYGLDAAQFLSQATGEGKRMTSSIERRERRQQQRGKDPLGSQPLLHVVLSKEGASAAESVNADMLRAGLARVKVGKNQQVGFLHYSEDQSRFGCLASIKLAGVHPSSGGSQQRKSISPTHDSFVH